MVIKTNIHPRPHTTQQFTYLGSILSSDSDLTNEIQQRVKLASSAFGRLASRVFFNRNLTVSTKVAVYKAICLSILLYGCESWIPYDDTSRRWKPIMSAASKGSSAFVGGKGEDTYRNTRDCQNWICWAPITTIITRKLCYSKDDRAMRAI